jgi:SAM-dependent methyltransferase
MIFNHNSLKLHRQRTEKTLHKADFLIKRSSADLLERLDAIPHKTTNILDIGSRDSAFLVDLQNKATNLTIAELSYDPEDLSSLPTNHFDLITSTLFLHNINDVPKFLLAIKNLLTEKGLFVASLFGGTTLIELKQACLKADMKKGEVSPRISPFIDVKTMGMLLQKTGFSEPVTDSDKVTVQYDDAYKLMEDLRNMGESTILTKSRKHFTTRSEIDNIATCYKELYENIATFEIINLTAFKD